MKKNSVKHARINQAVQREISNIIRSDLKDPRISPVTSVTAVDVATDLKTCKVYISVLGDDKAKEDVKKALARAGGFIRSSVASKLNMRNTPKFTFIMDDSIEYAVSMSEMINRVISQDSKAAYEVTLKDDV